MREGCYEVRLEHGETIWANSSEQQDLIHKLEAWQGGMGAADEEEW